MLSARTIFLEKTEWLQWHRCDYKVRLRGALALGSVVSKVELFTMLHLPRHIKLLKECRRSFSSSYARGADFTHTVSR